MKKVENYKLEKFWKKLKLYIKKDKKVINFNDIIIEEHEFHQYKSPISINDIEINEVVVSNMFTFGKQGFKYFIDCKDLYAYFSQKWVYIKDILMRLNVCILW